MNMDRYESGSLNNTESGGPASWQAETE